MVQNVTATSERLAVLFGGKKYTGDDNYDEDDSKDYHMPYVQIDKVWVAERKVSMGFIGLQVMSIYSFVLNSIALACSSQWYNGKFEI